MKKKLIVSDKLSKKINFKIKLKKIKNVVICTYLKNI